MYSFYQEGLLKLVDEVTLWRERRVDEKNIFSALLHSLRYVHRFLLEGGSKSCGMGSGKPLMASRFGTLFRYAMRAIMSQ
jgi:hypothetical protein